MTARTLIIMPTYNEAENLTIMIGRLRASVPYAEILIVDDGSPDGTGDRADQIATEDPQVHVMHRTGKLGLGSAYIMGFTWGLDRGFDLLIEIDADGSHAPEQLPDLLAAMGDPTDPANDGPDLVLGSRWVPGGRVINWPKSREFLSRGGSLYTRMALGVPLRDATGGFRVFRASTLRAMDFDSIESHGYCFQVDMAWRVLQSGGKIEEVPITFAERERGQSKMSRGIVFEAMGRVTIWGAKYRWSQLTGRS